MSSDNDINGRLDSIYETLQKIVDVVDAIVTRIQFRAIVDDEDWPDE